LWRFCLPAAIPTVAALVLAAWLVRLEWVFPRQEAFRDYRAFAGVIRRCAPRPGEVVFFQTEAHALAFHVGRPVAVVVQWEELRKRLARPGSHCVVLPTDCLAECPRRLAGLGLQEVLRNTDLSGGSHERPLALLRAGPCTNHSEDRFSTASHARAAEAAAGRLRTAQRGPAGP
jgi:hypothetical protein